MLAGFFRALGLIDQKPYARRRVAAGLLKKTHQAGHPEAPAQ